MGRSIYLSDNEIKALKDVATEWCSIMGDGSETSHLVDESLNNGLGSALYKLYKGCNGERIYKEYIEK